MEGAQYTSQEQDAEAPMTPRALTRAVRKLEEDIGIVYMALSTMQGLPKVSAALNEAFMVASPAQDEDEGQGVGDDEDAAAEAFAMAHLDVGSESSGSDFGGDEQEAHVHFSHQEEEYVAARPQSPVASRRFEGFVRGQF